MKNSILSLLFIAAFCLQGNTQKVPTVIQNYFTWLDAGHPEKSGTLLCEKFNASAPFSPVVMDKNTWIGVGKGFVTAFPDMKHQIVDCISSKNKVVVKGIFSGTNEGPMMGNPATGNKVSTPFVTIFELDGKKITSLTTTFDQKLFESQLMAGLPDPAVKAESDIRSFLKSVDDMNIDKALSYCAENFIHYFGGKPGTPDDFKNRLVAYKTAFPDIQRQVEKVYYSTGAITVKGRTTGTNTGMFMGKNPSNKKMNVSWIGIYELNNDGKISKAWVEVDKAGMESQIYGDANIGMK